MILKPGDRAPDFELPVFSTPDGEPGHDRETAWRLSERLARGPVFLVFAKESCPTCEYGLPLMDRIGARFKSGAFSAAFVAQETALAASRMARDWELKTTLLIDSDPHPVSERFGLIFVPSGFWINQRGVVENVFESFQREELKTIYRKAAAAVGLTPAPLFGPEEFVPPFRPG